MSSNMDQNSQELEHVLLHEQIDKIIANGVLPQYYPAIQSFIEQEKCLSCCSLILKNYPAVELWMHWNGFDQIEEQIFHNAVEYGDPKEIFSEYEDGYQHWPLLFRAVSNQHLSLVKKIIERCPKVLEHVCDNDNVFSFAINLDRNEVVNYLLDLLTDKTNSKYRKYLKLGPKEFVSACNRIDCHLDVIKRLLDIVLTQYEDEWKEDFVRGIQMMIFKHLHELPALLTYFCQKYPMETPVLYEQTSTGDVLLFSIAVDQPSILIVLENDEKAIRTKDKNDKTLLMRAIEVQNLELVQLLFSPKYQMNVNDKDNCDKTPLSYAISLGNPFVIQCLLEHGAKMIPSHIDDEKIESHVIRCDDEEIINFAISALNGSTDINTFSNVLNCLYNASSGSKWPWFRRNNTRKLFFPSLTNDKVADSQMIERFNEIYKVLYGVKIINRCENIFDMFFLDPKVTYEQKEFVAQPGGFLQIQMALMIQEPYLEYPCGEMYDSKEFNLIKDYLSIESFNEVAEGRELPSLKRLCRSVIRHHIITRVIEEKLDQLEDFDIVFVDLFDSLPIPQQLKEFLRYQN